MVDENKIKVINFEEKGSDIKFVNASISNPSGNDNKIRGSLNLNCFYTNIRSLTNNYKRDELLLLIEEHQFDIIWLAESWSHEGILDGEVSFDGFNLFRKDRSDGRRGGGS